jgi:hypothetical protein
MMPNESKDAGTEGAIAASAFPWPTCVIQETLLIVLKLKRSVARMLIDFAAAGHLNKKMGLHKATPFVLNKTAELHLEKCYSL